MLLICIFFVLESHPLIPVSSFCSLLFSHGNFGSRAIETSSLVNIFSLLFLKYIFNCFKLDYWDS